MLDWDKPYECEGQMTLDEVLDEEEKENNPCTPQPEDVS
jgi:hypothetical protein